MTNFLRKLKHSEEHIYKLSYTYPHSVPETFTLPPFTVAELFMLLARVQICATPYHLFKKIPSSVPHCLFSFPRIILISVQTSCYCLL